MGCETALQLKKKLEVTWHSVALWRVGTAVSPKYPGLQRHCDRVDERAALLALSGHTLDTPFMHHTPGPQAAHAPPFAPEYPALHTQLESSLDPS
jgi:hypothetical protein